MFRRGILFDIYKFGIFFMIFVLNGIVDRNVSRIFWEVDWFIVFLVVLRIGLLGLFCEFIWKLNVVEMIVFIVKYWWSL